MKNLRGIVKWSGVTLAVALAAIQFVPVERTNPSVESEIPAPAAVRAVLHQSCYNCHSNETVWPWYSRIAPFSWLVAGDVHEARGKMNFSTWNRLGPKMQVKALQQIWDEAEEGAMPPQLYRLPHPASRLTADDLAILRAWTQAAVEE